MNRHCSSGSDGLGPVSLGAGREDSTLSFCLSGKLLCKLFPPTTRPTNGTRMSSRRGFVLVKLWEQDLIVNR